MNRKIRRLPLEEAGEETTQVPHPCPDCGEEMELVGIDDVTRSCRSLHGCINCDWYRVRSDGKLEKVPLPF